MKHLWLGPARVATVCEQNVYALPDGDIMSDDGTADCPACLPPATNELLVEAKTFKAWASLDGIPVDIVIRAFVEGDRVLAIRSALVVDPGGRPYPRVTNGKMTAASLAVLGR